MKDKQPISPWHDIPLWASKSQSVAHMIYEIPKGTQAKMEISKKELLNPIVQDVKVQHWGICLFVLKAFSAE